ncbi:mCG56775 [Mus musculus]|nr:mCG56775 [Mus musculus]
MGCEDVRSSEGFHTLSSRVRQMRSVSLASLSHRCSCLSRVLELVQ